MPIRWFQYWMNNHCDELGHAMKLAKRIIELGGEPVMNPSRLIENGGCGYKEPPKDPTDLKQLNNRRSSGGSMCHRILQQDDREIQEHGSGNA